MTFTLLSPLIASRHEVDKHRQTTVFYLLTYLLLVSTAAAAQQQQQAVQSTTSSVSRAFPHWLDGVAILFYLDFGPI